LLTVHYYYCDYSLKKTALSKCNNGEMSVPQMECFRDGYYALQARCQNMDVTGNEENEIILRGMCFKL